MENPNIEPVTERRLKLVGIALFLLIALAFVLFVVRVPKAQAYTGDSFTPKPMCSYQEPPSYQPELKRGHYGLNVELAQAQLGITADGCFGPGTNQAVIDFQSCHGLYIDGIIGNQTWSALDSGKSLAGCVRNVQLVTVELPAGSTSSIEVDQWREVVRLKVGDTTIDTMPMIDNHYALLKGTYNVCGFQRTNHDVTLTLELPNFVRLCDSNGTDTRKGFHAIPIYKHSRAVLHDDSFLGTGLRQSSGCIRLKHADSQILWDFAKSGMKVVVK